MLRNLTSRLKTLFLCAGLLSGIGANAATIQVTANLTGTNTWRNTNEYVLNGFIYVLTNSVLNIEPGTVIRGKAGTGLSSSALFITQGAKIFANGTRAKPIIFTSETDDLTDPTDIALWQRGLWGGVVIYGRSVLNTASDVTGNASSPKFDVFEGLPDSQVNGQFINRFGGNDDNDNSGVFRYVSIRYPGTVILPNKELNGLSLGAVGRGTKVENIEVYGSADDSVEFFGGTVNTKYMSSIFSDDDNFDIDQGYRGKNQFWFVLQAPDRKDNGGEWNGEPNGLGVGNAPVANFEIYNATYIGAGSNGTPTRALISRVYAAPKVFNSIFTQFGGDILNIDATSGAHFTNGLAKIQNNIWWNLAIDGTQVTAPAASAGNWVITNAVNNNQVQNPLLVGISRTNLPAFGLDPRLQANSPALTNSPASTPNDGFYTPVSYSGAFKDVNWASEWGFAAEVGLITGEGAGTPAAVIVPNAPTILVGTAGGNIQLSFATQNGFIYQVQSATVLTGAPEDWANVGSAITGDGTGKSFSELVGLNNKFYRVIAR